MRASVTLAMLLVAAQLSAASNDAYRVLAELKIRLDEIRAMTIGTYPDPPETDLGPLIGVSQAEILRHLGKPDWSGPREWGYRFYNPELNTFGGGIALMIDYSDRLLVKRVRWQQQR